MASVRVLGPVAVCLSTLLAGHDGWAAKLLLTKSGVATHWVAPIVTVARARDRTSGSVSMADQAVDEAIKGAIEEWNKLPEMRVRFASVAGQAPAISVRFCKGGWIHPAGLLAHTEFQAEVDTGIVAAAVIEVNECDYAFVGPDEVEDAHFDLQSVLTHELGHALGLGHSDDPRAVMFTSTGTVRQRHPNPDDRTGLSQIYGTSLMIAPPATTVRDGRPGVTDGKNLLVAGAAPSAPHAAPAVKRRAGSTPPADMIQMVRLDGNEGLVLYTSDPVILPAMDTALTADAAKAKGHRVGHAKPQRRLMHAHMSTGPSPSASMDSP